MSLAQFIGSIAVFGVLMMIGVATLAGSTGPTKERRIRHSTRAQVDRIMRDYHAGAFTGAQAAYRLREIEVPLDVIQRKLTEMSPRLMESL